MTIQCDHNHDLETAKAELFEAFVQLHDNITRAFEGEPEYPRTMANERERHAAALVAVGSFLSRLVGRPIGDRFFELGSMIADLNTGTDHFLLKPENVDNRRADTSEKWRARARVVLAFDALVRFGLSQDAAAFGVVSKLPKVAALTGAKSRYSSLQMTLRGWRERLSAGQVKNSEAQEFVVCRLGENQCFPEARRAFG
jgi:hypothetical protein